MTRFYIRVIFLMFLTFVVTIIIILASMGELEKLYFRPHFAEQMEKLGEDLEQRLKDKSAEEAREEIARLEESQRLIFQIEVIEATRTDRLAPESSLYFRPKDAPYLLRFRPDIAQFRSFQQRQGTRFLASLVLSAIIILLAALLVVWPLIRKLRLQEQTIHAIAEGDLDARAPEGGDALGRLGARLNQMTRRIKELLAGQRQLIHAVSHEMRTPTARLGFGLEMLADAQSEEELKKRIAAMHDDLSEMDGLLEELLSFLRFDQGEEEFSMEQLGLHEMLEELRAKVQPFGPEIEIHTSSIPPGARLTANGHHFPRAVENLMRNAIRHANSMVTIRFATSGSTASLHIDDDGAGIPVDDRLRVFEPFIRLDSSRDRKTGGTGLGLAISHRICKKHEGTLTADESPEGGARFTITLPL